MDNKQTERIISANRCFYQQTASSFAQTRSRPWSGWVRALDVVLPIYGAQSKPALRVLDAACGNLRFESFLISHAPSIHWDVLALDGCEALWQSGLNQFKKEFEEAKSHLTINAKTLDLLDDSARAKVSSPFDLVVCFGFFHHVPSSTERKRLLQWLGQHTAQRGHLLLSFWCFEQDEAFIQKLQPLQLLAAHETSIALKAMGDWWLPWQNTPGIWRYCHSFNEREIHELLKAGAPELQIVDSFFGSGSGDRLNNYVVLRKP